MGLSGQVWGVPASCRLAPSSRALPAVTGTSAPRRQPGTHCPSLEGGEQRGLVGRTPVTAPQSLTTHTHAWSWCGVGTTADDGNHTPPHVPVRHVSPHSTQSLTSVPHTRTPLPGPLLPLPGRPSLPSTTPRPSAEGAGLPPGLPSPGLVTADSRGPPVSPTSCLAGGLCRKASRSQPCSPTPGVCRVNKQRLLPRPLKAPPRSLTVQCLPALPSPGAFIHGAVRCRRQLSACLPGL